MINFGGTKMSKSRNIVDPESYFQTHGQSLRLYILFMATSDGVEWNDGGGEGQKDFKQVLG